jgi:cytochrome c peroxidase
MNRNSNPNRIGFVIVICMLLLFCLGCKDASKPEEIESLDLGYLMNNKDLQVFGEKLFFDNTLSMPEGQACASCHGPDVGWTGPDEQVNKACGIYSGAIFE